MSIDGSQSHVTDNAIDGYTPHNLFWQAMSIDCYRPQIYCHPQYPSVGTDAHYLL